jgi:hypothetical protein
VLVFYCVVRGGLFWDATMRADRSPFGVAALTGRGLCSNGAKNWDVYL